MASKLLGSILLVAGTAIGAGMLALPLSTGRAGFIPAAILFFCCFLFMLCTLFILLEANLYSKEKEANIITMSKDRLGLIGQIIAWAFFLLLLYSVAAAYMSAGGALIGEIIDVPFRIGIFIFIVIFGCIVVFGTRGVDFLNRLAMIGLIVTYFILLIFASPSVESKHLEVSNPKYLLVAVPVVILSFTSHIIVPSLRTYLKSNRKALIYTLLLGSVIPLLFYLTWQFIITGILPEGGKFGLLEISSHPHPVAQLTEALRMITGKPWIAIAVGLFSFFALVTSFFGVALSLFDFLADGLNIKKTFFGKSFLLMMMFVPPLLFSLFYPSGFILALGYAGVFVAILYGILPTLMVWRARYFENVKGGFRLFGGRPLLTCILIGAVLIIFLQIFATHHLLQ